MELGILGLKLVIWLAFGIVCALIASSRGRSPVGWFFIGLIGGCFALIILLVIQDLKVEEERQRALKQENRRLREMLRGDRQVADQRHADSQRRLSAHDRSLGMDTSQALAAPEEQQPTAVPPPAAASESLLAECRAADWYYLVGEQQVGPMDFQSFKDKWLGGQIPRETLIWASYMQDWSKVYEVQGLEEALRA